MAPYYQVLRLPLTDGASDKLTEMVNDLPGPRTIQGARPPAVVGISVYNDLLSTGADPQLVAVVWCSEKPAQPPTEGELEAAAVVDAAFAEVAAA